MFLVLLALVASSARCVRAGFSSSSSQLGEWDAADGPSSDRSLPDGPATDGPATDGPVPDGPLSLDAAAPDSATTKKWTQIDSAETATCGLLSTGKLYCWGKNTLGTGSAGPHATPQQVFSPAGFGGTWTQFSISDLSACAIDNLYQAFCWGLDSNGELGNGPPFGSSASDSLVPVEVVNPAGFSGKWSSISVGDHFACGIDSNGKAYCWGRGDYGILGDGTTSTTDKPSPSPIAVPSGFSGSWSKIVCGHVDSCGVDSNGHGFCWGYNFGNKPTAVPSPVGSSGMWQAIHAGAHCFCGLASDGTIYCWGDDWDGALGNGSTQGDKTVPYPIDSTKKFKMIGLDGESYHACALSTAGEILCWGENWHGEVGVPSTTKVNESPLVVAPSLKFDHVAIGELISCGIDSTGAAHCWGDGSDGALGDGKSVDSYLPVKVVMP